MDVGDVVDPPAHQFGQVDDCGLKLSLSHWSSLGSLLAMASPPISKLRLQPSDITSAEPSIVAPCPGRHQLNPPAIRRAR